MIEDLNKFIKSALEAAGKFDDIVTSSDERFADYDAKPSCAMFAVRIGDVQNIDMKGEELFLYIRILILISDWDKARATEKFINMHKQISGQYVAFTDSRFLQEDLFVLAADGNNPEQLVNLPREHTLGIEYEGKITVDTTL